MLIGFDGPLDLRATLECGQAFRWRRQDPEPWFHGVVFGNVVKMRRKAQGVEFFCAPDDESTMEPLLREYLRLEDDLDAIHRSMAVDQHITAAIARWPGLRLLRQDPWECLISFICSANSNIRRISGNIEDMSTRFGRPLGLGDGGRSSFPTPEELADVGEARLRTLGLGFRAKYVDATARSIAGGDVDLAALRETPYEEAVPALTALPGVGPKVADCVLLFSLDKLEAFPVDVWVRRALRESYPEVANMPPREIRPWARDRFGPYCGYANQYLFHSRRQERGAKIVPRES